MALVSYGTQFLRDEYTLEDWCRHNVFGRARLQFRDPANNGLLADDFTLWLCVLKASGATRLSLHLADDFKVGLSPARQDSGCVIAVHFAQHYEVWMAGTEPSAWLTHPQLPLQNGRPTFPHAIPLGCALDTYWLAEKMRGALAVPDTNWSAITKAIVEDLDISIPTAAHPAQPFSLSASRNGNGKNLPLFPMTEASAQAHLLLTVLESKLASFKHDTHPKNEGNLYFQLSDAKAEELRRWAARLESWITEVRLRCANEYRASSSPESGKPLVRLHAPPLAFERDAATPEEDAGVKPEKPDRKWVGSIGWVVALIVLCLLVLALSNIIARFPWLSVLIALPWMLYIRYRKDL